MEKLFQIPAALYLEHWNRLGSAGNTRMSKIRPLLRDGVEMDEAEREGTGIGVVF